MPDYTDQLIGVLFGVSAVVGAVGVLCLLDAAVLALTGRGE